LAGVAITLFEKLCAADKDQASVDAAYRLVELDPLREASQRALMRSLAAAGETALALQQYKICRALLQAEFGIEPASETVALRDEIARAKTTSAKVPAVAGVEGGHGRPKQSESKPAIAILPFANLSGDPAQEYIGNGMAEDIGIELARYHSLSVVASNASSHFRGPGLDLAAIRQVLGVRYVVAGSIRKGRHSFRMTVQLIEAETGKQLWAERYDKADDEIFAVQDDVVRTIVSTIEGRLAVTAAAQLRAIPTTSWAAYDYFLQGRELSNRYRAHEADRFLARAIELDPSFVHAYAWRASTLIVRYWDDLNPKILQQAVDCANKALSLDEFDAWCHQAMGFVSLHSGKIELAGMHFERAISLNPNDVNILADYANWLCYAGRFDEAMECLDRAMQRDPFPPAWMWEVRGSVLLLTHCYEEAIIAFQKAPIENFFTHACLAAAYAWAGHTESARFELALARQGREETLYAIMAHFPNPRRDHILEGLRKAGLTE
jgi:TolB-like protein